ncbi:unnamed protein product [Mycena citricolor]|uniref:IMD domain-containing protein n=1 Tax=Mycena citricolor TaxID=2018698 RepID=A0AAD2HHL5_9AGAR|nr:unnamed protein product [Mycena citricolor]
MAPSFIRSRRTSARGRSPSPTFSDTTNASAMNFGVNGPEKIITRTHLKASILAYENLMSASAQYRSALVSLSNATAAFANAMEAASVLRGPSYEAGTRLQAAAGLHHLMGNHWQVLAETLDKKVEKPLKQHLDTYKTIVAERSASYERTLKDKSQIIRDTEMRNMNKKERNLQSFREALTVLQRQVDDLDDLKVAHYQEIVEHEEEVWNVVQGKVHLAYQMICALAKPFKICIVVRSTMDVFDKFTSKASDPIIEPMLQAIPDPFDSYGAPQPEDQIFSILAPLSIMTSTTPTTASPMPTPIPELDHTEGLPGESNAPPWMVPNPTTVAFPSLSPEWEDQPSSPPRSISPPFTGRKQSATTGRHSRKSESMLRSVLMPIDESRSRQASEDRSEPLSISPPPPEANSWAYVYGHTPYDSESAKSDGDTPTLSSFPHLNGSEPEPVAS